MLFVLRVQEEKKISFHISQISGFAQQFLQNQRVSDRKFLSCLQIQSQNVFLVQNKEDSTFATRWIMLHCITFVLFFNFK